MLYCKKIINGGLMNILSKYLFITGLITLIQCSTHECNKKYISYFSKQHPGLKPEIVAPEIFSHTDYRLHGFPTFSPNGKEIYWPVVPPKILFIKNDNNKWSKPAIASFTEGNIQAPLFSINGKKLFFQLSHPEGHGSLDIWYVEKNDTTWSMKKNLGSPPNTAQMESQPSFTNTGTIYYTGSYENGLWNRGIYKSRYRNKKYENPELLPEPINTQYLDYTPFI